MSLLSWGLVLESNGPELFGYEILNLLVPVHNEAEGGKLAGPIAYYIVVLAIRAKEDLSEVKRLQPCKACTYPQINFLSGPDSLSQEAVGFRQVLYGPLNIFLGQCREVSPLHCQVSVDSLAHINHVKCDGLTLPITIEPEDQFINVSCLLLDVFDDIYTVFHGNLLQWDYIMIVIIVNLTLI